MIAATPFAEITLIGLASGAAIALLALGLVLIYRTTGILNFAHWAIGLLAVVAYLGISEAGVPAALAALLSMPLAIVGGVVAYRLVFRDLPKGAQIIVILIAVGVAQVYTGIVSFALKFQVFTALRPWLPVGEWRILGVNVRSTDLVTAGMAIAVAFGFLFWFRRSTTGRALRAVAQNREAAVLAGVDEARYSAIAWGIGSGLSALAMLLVLPHAAGAGGGIITAFDLSPLGTLLIPAFGAALVGGLVHLPMAVAGGFLFGLARELLILAPKPFSDLRTSIAAILIVLLLLARTERFFTSSQELEALEA